MPYRIQAFSLKKGSLFRLEIKVSPFPNCMIYCHVQYLSPAPGYFRSTTQVAPSSKLLWGGNVLCAGEGLQLQSKLPPPQIVTCCEKKAI